MSHSSEDFRSGQVFVSQDRTITEADLVTFAVRSWDTNPVHTDAEAAQQGRFGNRSPTGSSDCPSRWVWPRAWEC
jgi:acyl dehydratase